MTSKTTEPNSEPQTPVRPTLREMLMLEMPVEAKASPGGDRVAIRVRTTNWKENRYEHVCHIHDLASGATYPLTRTGDVQQMEWIDNQTLALLRDGPGKDDKPQVWLYEGLIGEGWAATDHKTGVQRFYPFAGGLLFRATDPEREERKPRADRFGEYTHWEHEESAQALYYTGLAEMREYQARSKAATEDEAKDFVLPVIELSRLWPEPLSIGGVVPAPDGDAVYFNACPRDDLVYYHQTAGYAIRLDPAAALAEFMRREKEKKLAKPEPEKKDETEKEDVSYLGEIVRMNLPRDAVIITVSPDGRSLLLTYQERDNKMYTRADLWTMDAAAAWQAPDADAFLAGMRNISAQLDRDVMDMYWTKMGIVGSYVESTHIRLARFGEDGQVAPLDLQGLYLSEAWFSAAKSGRIGLIGANAQTFPEAYLVDLAEDGVKGQARKLSDFGRAVATWEFGTIETIRWPSKDGTLIEGVLRKPANFDPAKRYPLVFVVHGGPTWFSGEYMFDTDGFSYYPDIQFIYKDVLVLKPNYRGSTGRGQAFLELNVDNLGVGDLWDIESAIDTLDQQGLVDTARVGCMGWSQGGYISAFAGLHSERFKAVSVGAGISDWYTYHISNDIPNFTTEYLSGSPFRNRERYLKTAPISNLANAKTPMLIQHGSDDHRVPLSNAMELYRGLQEMGVPVELFVFPGMGHPITKPRENHAVMHQNLAWFSHYLLGEALELE
ncbi:MAG: S9 family peptidase [Anaerolineae bacterium]|nr:S9 family peptidase [Anaerolineae bacterium]